MTRENVVIVMPAYNEADGLAEFLREIRREVEPYSASLQIIVVDDASTDGTMDAANGDDRNRVLRQAQNRGHGPTALIAYRAALDSGAGTIVHVDGDGQFLGEDIARVMVALWREGADVVHGVRRGRTDPWYRRALSLSLRAATRGVAGRPIPDLNTPLRAFRPAVLAALMTVVPADALVPHVHFSIAEARGGMVVRYVAVRSQRRRGVQQTGTMWGAPARVSVLPPRKLLRFVGAALAELWRVSIRPGVAGRGRAGVER